LWDKDLLGHLKGKSPNGRGEELVCSPQREFLRFLATDHDQGHARTLEVSLDPNADKNFPKLCISKPRFSVVSRILMYTVLSGPASSQLTAKHGGL